MFLMLLNQKIGNNAISHKINYVTQVFDFLNLKEHQHPIIGSRVTGILLDGWILPIGGAASGRVCDRRGYPV